jgi:hypothetical protein
MKERPILFSTEMVKAILDGRKTMTRRVVSFKNSKPFDNSGSWPYVKKLDDGTYMWSDAPDFSYPKDYLKDGVKCPYGQVGDRLWVRETWTVGGYTHKKDAEIVYKASEGEKHDLSIVPWNDWLESNTKYGGRCGVIDKWRSSMFMPRWASRITLEITNIRVERLQDITDQDAIKEGIDFSCTRPNSQCGCNRKSFSRLWDSINAKRGYSWGSNPWVWVIEFKRIK